MRARLTKNEPSQLGEDRSNGSTYSVSETAYFQKRYGSDHLHQLHDDHQEEAIYRYAYPEKLKELKSVLQTLSHLTCENDPKITQPGRSAYSIKQLKENLLLYCRKQPRSLRWNEHYQQALAIVAKDVHALLKGRGCLQPMSIDAVAASEQLVNNLDKNAGYMVFESGKRSKGENLDEAVKWCHAHLEEILDAGHFGLPLVMSHRASNSKPTRKSRKDSYKTWKWRCRVILMEDVRHLLLDGHFAIPFINMFKDCPWGEGGMTQSEVAHWIAKNRRHFDAFYSSDYSKFDVSQAPWLLEDVMYKIVKPCFGELSAVDDRWYDAMVNSYIHKDIHGPDGVYHADGCQISGSLTTYAYNTIINQVIDTTVLLMQGCDLSKRVTLKCGDDNLTYYKLSMNWDRDEHLRLIKKYFGINTTLGEDDCGPSTQNPTFLSREWGDNGEYRDIHEVLWNLVYPERYRKYNPEETGVSVLRAEALVLLCAYREQVATMREYFDLRLILRDAQVQWADSFGVYKALASMGSGFRTPWINFKFGNLKRTA